MIKIAAVSVLVMAMGAVSFGQAQTDGGSPSVPTTEARGAFDTSKIESLTGLKGTMNAKEGVFKVSFPRNDIHMVVDDSGAFMPGTVVTVTPPMGLTAWVAFKETPHGTMCMGDTVLLEEEVNPVMSVALENGLEVTALHNHFFFDRPKVYFMHIGGMGKTEELASGVGKVYGKIKELIAARADANNPARDHAMPGRKAAEIDPAKTTLDPKKIDAILGTKGDFAKGVYKVTFGKTTEMSGHEMGNAMGVNTWAAFAGSDEKAAVMGDFAMYEKELQGVLKVLRGAGINVVAIHNHMNGESPRVVFLHYWGIGPTEQLAKGLKGALDTQK